MAPPERFGNRNLADPDGSTGGPWRIPTESHASVRSFLHHHRSSAEGIISAHVNVKVLTSKVALNPN